MQRLIAVRLFHGFITLFVVSLVVFVLSRASGDPVNLLLPPDAPPEARTHMAQVLGLDKSLPEQYLTFLSQVVRGDLGRSLKYREPVGSLYLSRLPNTLQLTVAALLFACLVGLPLGALAAIKKGTAIDSLARLLSTIGIAMPLFWFGLVLMQVFAVWLRWVNAGGMAEPKSYVLPAVTLGLALMAGMSRLLRSGMLDVLDSEYVKMLRIKGLAERKVIFPHAFRNAFIAPLTFLGQYTALLLGGAVVVEVIFAWPGVGRLSYEAIVNRDFPVIQGIVLINASILILANLLVDILYAYVDPRIRSAL